MQNNILENATFSTFIILLIIISLVFLIRKSVYLLVGYYSGAHKKIFQYYNLSQHISNVISCSLIFFGYSYYLSPYLSSFCSNNVELGCRFFIKTLHIINYLQIILLNTHITLLLLNFTNALFSIYKKNKLSQSQPEKLTFLVFYIQILKILILVLAIIITFSLLFNIPLKTCLTSLGAATALITFIFKDAILGLFAGLVLTLEEVVLIGDNIKVPQYSIEGVVEKVDPMFVTIRNNDNTTSTISTYNLMLAPIINLRRAEEL